MTEQQADRIIALLESIDRRLATSDAVEDAAAKAFIDERRRSMRLGARRAPKGFYLAGDAS